MATVTLRPNGAGFSTQWAAFGGANWECVDDVVADDGATIISSEDTGNLLDLYTIESNSIGASDTINSITIYFRNFVSSGKFGTDAVRPAYRENSTTSIGAEIASIESWTTDSETFTVRGSDSGPFTKSDIDSLQIGVQSQDLAPSYVNVTQIYVVVDYTPSGGGSPVVKPVIMMLETDD